MTPYELCKKQCILHKTCCFLIFCVSIFFLLISKNALAQIPLQNKKFQKELILMGSRFEITAISNNEKLALESIASAIEEIRRIESLISSWVPKSQCSEINKYAGIQPVRVEKELFNLIKRSKKISVLTDGAFDITFAALGDLWKFDDSMKTFPEEDKVKKSIRKVNYKNIILDEDNTTVFLKEKGMKIGFGAIGKGYAANKAKKIMLEKGINAGLVNAGGDLIAWGKTEKDSDWRIGITDPKNRDKILSWIKINDMSVVTSGDYEKFFEYKGKRYSHIIDPRTGYPVLGIKSVTIICPDAELADALATSVFVLGEKKGLTLINQLKDIECLIINDKDQLISSKNLEVNYYQE